jgi:hypothetical protein
MTPTVLPFRWLALFPRMGAALKQNDIGEAAACARYMITPPQQRLPDELTGLLGQGVATWERGEPDAASDLLRAALRLAGEMHYV